MKFIVLVVFLFYTVLLPYQSVYAQEENKGGSDFEVVVDDENSGKEAEKHTIVVTGTRSKKRLKDSPVITEVITEEEIHESRADTLNDVMEDYGLQFMNNAMGDYIRLQGMEADKVLFLVDGRRISGRVAKRLDAATIPVSNIERIEIVRGPQSLLYGSDGMGGVINIITKKPGEGISLNGKVSTSFIDPSDNDDVFLMRNGQASVNLSMGPVYSLMHADFSDSDYVLSDDGQVSVAPRYKQGRGGIILGVTPSSMLDVNFGGNFSKRESDTMTSRYGSYERVETTRADGFVDVAYDFSSSLSFNSKLYCNYYLRDKEKYSALTDTWDDTDNKEEADLYVAEFFSAVSLSESNTLLLGVETLFDELYKYNLGADGGGATKTRNRVAFVIQDEQSRKNSYSVMGGVRIERDSVFGVFASPKVSAMHYLSRSTRLLGGIGVGYRAPDFSDLYLNKIDNPSHPVVLGNEDLEPEKSIGSNLGFELSTNSVYFIVNLFHNELFDEMVNELQDYQDNGRDVYIKTNLNRTMRSGADFEGRINLSRYISLSAGYNFVIGYDRRNDVMIEDQPMHTVRGKVMFKYAPFDVLTYVNARYQSEVEDYEDSSILVMNYYISKKFYEHMKVFFSLENLTDRVNDDIGLSLGRTFTVGMEAWY